MEPPVDGLLRLRRPSRSDGVPDVRGDAWNLHAPYLTVLLALLGAGMLLPDRERGLVACGVAIGFLLRALVERSLREGFIVAHYAAGLLVIGLFYGTDSAGAYALPACLYLTGALLARAVAGYFSLPPAPMTGRSPWAFAETLSRQMLFFGVAGAVGSVVGIALAPGIDAKVLSVALLPLLLRTYTGRMLAPGTRTKLWLIAGGFEACALVLLVPAAGPKAAPWIVVAGETILCIGSTVQLLERTGVRAARRELAIGTSVFLLIASVSLPLPEAPEVFPVLVVVLCALIWLVRRARMD